MTQRVFKTRNARTVRVTVLDDCCTPPVTGTECALSVFDAFTTFSASVNVEEGLSAFERKANGDICMNEQDPNSLTNMTLSLTLCNVRPEDISMLTEWPVTRDVSGNAIGFDIMEGSSERQVAIELFSGVAGVDCGEGAQYGYAVAPCTDAWQLDGEIVWAGLDTIQAITLTTTTNGNHAWGKGPYKVQDYDYDGTAEQLHDAMQTGAHMRIMTTTVPPPALTDGCVDATEANGFFEPIA